MMRFIRAGARQVQHFIAGAHKAGSDTRTGDIFDPGTGQVQAQVCMGTPADLDEAAALEAQRRAEQALSDQTGELELAKAKAELIQAAAQIRAIQKLRAKGGRA